MGLLDELKQSSKEKHGGTDSREHFPSSWVTPQTLTASVLTTATTLFLVRFYKIYVRRIPTVDYIKPDQLRKRSVYGYVTSVGDGDNFRLFHTPGGRFLGWGWAPGRKLGKMKKFQDKTIHVRIAGIDAPELAHFGKPAQPHSQEALDWLRSTILHKYVRVYPYRKDQYDRVVSTVFTRRWIFFKSDLGEKMLRQGLATVYEAKFGSEFGGKEHRYRKSEEYAKSKKVGMWEKPSLVGKILGKTEPKFESPREYKTRMAKTEKNSGKKK